MQFNDGSPTSLALAAALAPGQKRFFGVELRFDWQRDGSYGYTNNDLSDNYSSYTIDRQLTGAFPDKLEVTEGYSGAQLQITLEGVVADGTPVWRMFSPYSGFWPGTIGAVGTPMYLNLLVQTSTGVTAVRRFTGYIQGALPSRKAGNVVVTCTDLSGILTNPVTLPVWAQGVGPKYNINVDRGTLPLSWVLEYTLRSSGIYEGPAPHANAVLSWPLCHGFLPEIGTIGIEDADVVNNGSSFNVSSYITPPAPDSSSGYPTDNYVPGRYGQALKPRGLDPAGLRLFNTCAAHTSAAIQVAAPAPTNGANQVPLGGWVYIDSAIAQTSSMTVLLEQRRSFSEAQPAMLSLSVSHQTGLVTGYVQNSGQVKMWNWSFTPAGLTTGWHYIAVSYSFVSSAITLFSNVDGTITNRGTGGTSGGITSVTRGFDNTNTNYVTLAINGPCQYWQLWWMPDTAAGSVTWPKDQANPRAQIDTSVTRLNWLPDLQSVESWEVLKAAASADMGALYADEFGVMRFANRLNIQARHSGGLSVRTLSIDDMDEINPQTTFDSIINRITYFVQTKVAQDGIAYTTTDPGQWLTAAHSNRTGQITLSGVQSIRVGQVSWHPQTQGSIFGGGFACKDVMNFYKPDYWMDGYAGHQPGNNGDPSGCPPVGTGVNVYVYDGWGAGDQNQRHMRVFITNDAATTMQESVEDTTPFLHVKGIILVADSSGSTSIMDSASQAQFGDRNFSMPQDDWHQDALTIGGLLAPSLLADVKQAQPYFQSASIVGDPRLQLQDVVTIDDAGGMGGPIYASTVGINETADASTGLKQTLTLRTFS
jgi:hypothetical protein